MRRFPFLALVLLSCSDPEADEPNHAEARPGEGAGGSPAVSSPNQGGETGDDEGHSSDDDPSNAQEVAFTVDVAHGVFGSSFVPPRVAPVFAYSFHPEDAELECEEDRVGNCILSDCQWKDSATDKEGPDAGEVTVMLDVQDGPLTATTLPDDATGQYFSIWLEPEDLFLAGGETGSVTAQGAEIGAFEIPLEVPLVLLNTTPSIRTQFVYEIVADKNQDLVLTWDRGAPDVLYRVQTDMSFMDRVGRHLRCSFDSTTGTGTLPASLTSQLPGTTHLLTYTVKEHRRLVDGDPVLARIFTDTTVAEKDAPVVVRLTDEP